MNILKININFIYVKKFKMFHHFKSQISCIAELFKKKQHPKMVLL